MRLARALTALLVVAAAPLGAETLFINDATLYTMGSQGILQDADILLRDGQVKSLATELPVPADATVIEAEGRPVTPGLFAGVTQLGLVEISMDEPSVDAALAGAAPRPEFDVATAFNPASSLIPVTRIEGYTWTVLGATRGGSIFGGQGRAVALDGRHDAFFGGPILFIDVGGDASGESGGSRASQWMLLEQALSEAAATEAQWLPQPLLTLAGRKAMAAYASGGLVVFDADRASDILQSVDFAARHGLRPVIHGGAEAWKVADRLAEAGVPVVLDPLENLPGSFDELGARLDNAAILHTAGVLIAFSSGETHNARKLRHAAGNAVAHGLPYEAGLAAITSGPAAVFELEPGLGTLAPGSRADLVIWSGDPLEVTSAADVVVIAGERIEMVSRQTLLRDRYLETTPGTPRAYIKPR